MQPAEQPTSSYTTEQAAAAFAASLRADLNAMAKIAPQPWSLEHITAAFTGNRLPSSWRESELVALRDALLREKAGILVALETDLGVSPQEAELIEFVPLIQELEHVIRNHRKWFQHSLPVSVADYEPWLSDGSKVLNLPLGNVLLLGQAGNELATLVRPLIYAIAAGNYSFVVPQKLGTDSKSTTLWTTLEFILKKQMSQERLSVVEHETEWHSLVDKSQVSMVIDGRKPEKQGTALNLCAEKNIKYLAHGHLKNIAIIDKHANLADAGRQIGAHKFYKAGQDYNSIDIVYVHSSIQEKFSSELKNALFWHRGNRGPVQFQHGKLIDEDAFKNAKELVKNRDGKNGELLTSQFSNKDTLQVNPAVLLNPDTNSEILTGKNQNPILAIVTFDDLPELLTELSQKEPAHNLYFFTEKRFLFEEAKSLLPGRNLFFNCTAFYLKSGMSPNFVSNWMPHASLQGKSAFHTLSRQKVFTWDNTSKFSIANSKF